MGANDLDVIYASFRSAGILGTVANKGYCWICLVATSFSRLHFFDGLPSQGYLNTLRSVHLSEAAGMFKGGFELISNADSDDGVCSGVEIAGAVLGAIVV